MVHKALLTLIAALLGASVAAKATPGPSKRDSQPNIILVIADDLDSRMTELADVMPNLKKHMIDQGTTFPQHYCTVSLCCPSRATILTGKHAHNHNVTDVSYPEGGYKKFWQQGFNDKYLPVFLQDAGYDTYYAGKIMNEITIANYFDPYLKGWTGSEILLDPYTYDYLQPGMIRNKGIWKLYNGTYNTDLVAEKSMGFLEDAIEGKKPFFLGMAPIAPHGDVTLNITSGELVKGPPVSAPRHENMFADAKVPREANFNPDEASGASWVKTLGQLSDEEVEYGDEWYRLRLRALQAVDDMVGDLFAKLEAADLLDNTYVIFTSDNGFHISQHRLSPGKTCGYEEDINVPFIVRGPGISQGDTFAEAVSSHVDLLPTIFELAGIEQRSDFDGRPIALTEEEFRSQTMPKVEHANVEMWRDNNASFKAVSALEESGAHNTYKSVRLIGQDYSLYYSVWCTNEHELYDMSTDIYQMDNLFTDGFEGDYSGDLLGVTIEQLASRLDALLYVLKSCRGDSCRQPWHALMPNTTVNSLSDALDSSYNSFFEGVPRVSFSACEEAYIVSAEGPQFQTWTVTGTQARSREAFGPQGEDPIAAWMT